MGNALLHAAVHNGHMEIVNKLLENGASVNDACARYPPPLQLAAQTGDPEMIGLLLRNGAGKDALNSAGYSALYSAAQFGHLAATQALLDAGTDVGVRCGEMGDFAQHIAAEKGHGDVLKALIEHGANVDAACNVQNTALHVSAQHGRVKMIGVLVEAGANLHARDDTGRTPLHDAVNERQQGAELALLKHGAEVNAKTDRGDSPLHFAACNAGRGGAARKVDVLLRWGADEMLANEDGETPADIIGEGFDGWNSLPEDVEGVRQLLANAPADRAWRRRGYLAMCRAHPDRMQLADINQPAAGMTPRKRSRIKLMAAASSWSGGGSGHGATDERRPCGSWAAVVTRVLGLEEAGLFRAIVGYL